MKGHADLRQMFRNPNQMDINGYIRPSAAIDIQGVMLIDAFHTQSGLKFSTRMHQSASLDGSVELRQGKEVKIRWNVPQERMEFMDLE